ncbi:MAG TPA: undecaprenyldiphospho-muramoylpentapeptide beta-N-acetylglucosaminyltransferase [Abditibacteriaceae bacterium]|nr:undecaprenyldiphospho-muramoylpentapeptide beta-N-acetylglucosaminyltransferase [Abditibacteriaceae bacterium]
MITYRILVTGGGSSGHINPALAIIQAIKEIAERPEADALPIFLYMGGKSGLEQKLVEAAGIDFIGVETGKLRRYFSFQNFTDMVRLPFGIAHAMEEVAKFRPDVVLATGGYVAVPPVLGARMLGVPIIIHEQTVQIGLANRIAARCATRIALSFESALEELPKSLRRKAFVAGNPVRPAIFGGDKNAAIQFANFAPEDNNLPTVYVTGGSQGARIINRAVEARLPHLLQFCRIIHQCGQQPAGDEQDYDRLQNAAAELLPESRRRYFVTPFIAQEINHVYALADLVVGRAGAGTVTEVCTLGKPAVYIPLVPTGGDEQTRNAQMCERIGAAIIIPQSELDGPRLLAELEYLLADSNRLQEMGWAAFTLSKPDAAQVMAEAVLELAK